MALRLKWTASVIIVMAFVNVMNCFMRCVNPTTSNTETHPLERIQLFKRGQFKRLQEPAELQESINLVGTSGTIAAIRKEIKCNDAYYMLFYLHLTNPEYFRYPDEVNRLHMSINQSYEEWARKMLATAFNVTQNDTKMDVPWLLYLYVKRIEVHTAEDPDKLFLPALKKTHYGIYKVLLCTMFENDCTMFDRATMQERKFTAYVGAMKDSKPTSNDFSTNSDAVFEILKDHWPDLSKNASLGYWQEESSASGPVPGVQPLTEEHLTLNLLYLNGVFENHAMATTLLKDFGVLENGERLVEYLKERIKNIKQRSTSFRLYVLMLVDFHEHVQRVFNTMMLRLYYEFMEKLKMLNFEHREKHVTQFLVPYKEWCTFFHLPKNNPLYERLLLESSEYNKNFWSTTIYQLQQIVMTTLAANDVMLRVRLDNHTYESLSKIKIEESQLMITALEYVIPLDPTFKASLNYPTRTTILCAALLIGFMKNIFADINFKAIQSLVKLESSRHFERFQEYEVHYHPNVLKREDETRSIQVCGTHTTHY